MKHLLILTVGICLLISVPSMADQAEDEAAVKEAVEQYYTLANNHELEAVMALCAESYKSTNGQMKGCAAFREYLTDYWKQQPDHRIKVLEVTDIHFVSPNVAIFKALQEVTGRRDENGKTEPTFKRYVARVFVKEEDGQWRQATFFVWPPIEE